MAELPTDYEPVTTAEGHYVCNDQGEYLFRRIRDDALIYGSEDLMIRCLNASGGEGTSGGDGTSGSEGLSGGEGVVVEDGENVRDLDVQERPECEQVNRFWNSKPSNLEEYDDMTHLMLTLVFAPKTYAALNDKKTVKKQVWQQVAKSMAEVGAPIPSKSIAEAGQKCSQKYRNLMKSYKKYKLKVNETGTGPTPQPKYYDIVHPYFDVRADLNPTKIKNSRQPSAAAVQSNERPESLKFSEKLGSSNQFTSSVTTSAAAAPASASKPRNSIDSVCKEFFASPSASPVAPPSTLTPRNSSSNNNQPPSSRSLDASLISSLIEPEEEHIMENPDDVVLQENVNTPQVSNKSRHNNVRKRVKPRTTASNSEILTYLKESEKKDEEYRQQHLEIYKDEVKQNSMLLEMMKSFFEAKSKKRGRKSSKRRRNEEKENRYDTSDEDFSSD